MNQNLLNILKKILTLVILSLIFSIIIYVIAIFISKQFNYNIQDILFGGGLILIIIGGLMSIHGNPSGASLWGLGQSNAQYTSFLNLEAKKEENKIEDTRSHLLKNSIKKSRHINIIFIISGLFLIIYNQFFI
ncbi:hypothetical protein EDD66_103148 [Mobilisporobacter senegalensis]|uniref:DUF3899 domain-containing protein n=1 Tax=Mobilisporobacter senegalensis TaxID=1329262 RepID=A0A3N1XVK0_9FIRM|nr:hypothetical protein [Mobilisporobacter senegalensis]ROR29212.1 hypothetical protein EDD66_103148 [Mobilisporobacter senegalensis]